MFNFLRVNLHLQDNIFLREKKNPLGENIIPRWNYSYRTVGCLSHQSWYQSALSNRLFTYHMTWVSPFVPSVLRILQTNENIFFPFIVCLWKYSGILPCEHRHSWLSYYPLNYLLLESGQLDDCAETPRTTDSRLYLNETTY